ncbi:hypothetical protein JVT61DRAFT_6028 [Boletus reticuloceps]|uniref:DUF6533 domain-containing protein n=1 Tax=Boletus reticuloceps TaxID=495285 RepID=A0A8I2YL82_9AGAM|nr:hypothetical protein JVT61DRAFT_6028 [Boletus reticuloceps]
MSAAAEAEFLALLSAEELSKFCAIGAYTWFLYDYIIMLPTEIRYVWIKPWGISKALFLWMRYFGAAFLTVYMGILFTPSHSERVRPNHTYVPPIFTPTIFISCFHYFVWQGCGGSLILFTVEVVLQLRIFAMYNRNKTLATVNLVFFAMEIVAMLTTYNIGITFGTTLATPAGITGCWGFTTSYLFSIWFPRKSLAFECWLAGLAVWKAVDRSRKGVMVNGQKVDLLALLIRDSVIYFFLIAAGLASNAFIWLTSTSAVVSIVVPIAHASMIVGGSRLFLNLREAYYVSIDTTTWQIATKGQRSLQFARPGSNGLFRDTMGELTGTFTIPDFGLTYVELDEVNTDTTVMF